MIYSIYISMAFILALFLLFNGPLWASTRLHIFSRGRESPHWLVSTVGYVTRLLGIAGLIAWLISISQGNVSSALLCGVVLLGGLLLLLNVPLRLVTHIPQLKRGRTVSVRVETGYLWFSRIIGSVVIGCVLFLALWL